MSAESTNRTAGGSYATRPGNTTEPSVGNGAATPDAGRARRDSRSVPDLLRELSSEGADLVRQEVALAKAELNEKVQVFQRGMISIAMGGALLLAALLTALWAVNRGLTALLAQAVGVEVAVWLSPLILTAVLGGVGWSMVQKGKTAMAEEGLTPEKTKATLKADKRWAQRKAREVKEEIKHG